MADSSHGPESGARLGHGSTAGMPRWVKAFGLVALAVLLVVVIVLVTGLVGPGHGPGRHTPSGDAGTAPSGVSEGHRPPSWVPEHDARRR